LHERYRSAHGALKLVLKGFEAKPEDPKFLGRSENAVKCRIYCFDPPYLVAANEPDTQCYIQVLARHLLD